MHAYPGRVESPFPPLDGAWAAVGYGDELARRRAEELSQYRDGSPVMPAWHYHDELLRSGLYRFFSFVEPSGAQGVACCRYLGEQAPTLGALSDPTAGGGPTDTTGDGSGSGGGGKTDTGGGLPSGDTIQCDSPQVPNAAGTACVNPPGGGGGGPTPTPKPPGTVMQAGVGGSNGGLLFGILAALAVGGTVIAASAAKHPVRRGSKSRRR